MGGCDQESCGSGDLHAEKSTRGLSDEQMALLMAAIASAAHLDRNAKRDYVLIKWS